MADARQSSCGAASMLQLRERERKGVTEKATELRTAPDTHGLQGQLPIEMEKLSVGEAEGVSLLPSEHDSKASPVTKVDRASKSDSEADGTFNLVDFLTEHRLKFKDMRSKGGALWVIGGRDLAPYMASLKKKGIPFTYQPRGGKTTGYRPAWWYAGTKL